MWILFNTVMQSVDVFFIASLNKLLDKQMSFAGD